MQVGTQLRQKVVRLYVAGLPNRAQNCRASFSELSNYPYVGHSPDQVIKTAGTEARTLIKVKIDFSKAKSSPRTKPTNSPSNTMTRCSWACASTTAKSACCCCTAAHPVWRSAPCQVSRWTRKICFVVQVLHCRMRAGATNSRFQRNAFALPIWPGFMRGKNSMAKVQPNITFESFCPESSSIAGDDRHNTPSSRWRKTARHFNFAQSSAPQPRTRVHFPWLCRSRC